MAKKIKNPIEIKFLFEGEGIDGEMDLSAHYGVGADEYLEFNNRKGMPIVLTPTQETQIKRFAKDVIYPQILDNEGISK